MARISFLLLFSNVFIVADHVGSQKLQRIPFVQSLDKFPVIHLDRDLLAKFILLMNREQNTIFCKIITTNENPWETVVYLFILNYIFNYIEIYYFLFSQILSNVNV